MLKFVSYQSWPVEKIYQILTYKRIISQSRCNFDEISGEMQTFSGATCIIENLIVCRYFIIIGITMKNFKLMSRVSQYSLRMLILEVLLLQFLYLKVKALKMVLHLSVSN